MIVHVALVKSPGGTHLRGTKISIEKPDGETAGIHIVKMSDESTLKRQLYSKEEEPANGSMRDAELLS